ncbi:MAG: porin, partial [Pirellulaceae bacterium]
MAQEIKEVTKGDPTTVRDGKEKEKERESDQKWTVKLGGHVQTDYVLWANADPMIPSPDNYFEFRRLRLVADGVGYGNADFRLQMTLEPETPGETLQIATSPEVKDAYFTLNDLPWLGRLRIGHFFVPFGLEQVTNDTNNIFLERSIPTQGIFTADREVGIAIYNQNEDRRTTWSHGIFLDSISDSLKDRFDDNQGTRLSSRYTWLPIASDSSTSGPLLHLGAGALHTIDHNQLVRFRARPQIHEGPRLIDSGLISATDFTTGNVELAAIWRSFTLQSEAFLTRVDRI